MTEMTRSICYPTPNEDHAQAARKRVSVSFEGQGRTHPEHAAAADINHIVNRWRRTGEIEHVAHGEPFFLTGEEPASLQEALDTVALAEERFLELPSSVRNLCDNDPVVFLEMFQDQEGRQALEDAGLVTGLPKPKETAIDDDGTGPADEGNEGNDGGDTPGA